MQVSLPYYPAGINNQDDNIIQIWLEQIIGQSKSKEEPKCLLQSGKFFRCSSTICSRHCFWTSSFMLVLKSCISSWLTLWRSTDGKQDPRLDAIVYYPLLVPGGQLWWDEWERMTTQSAQGSCLRSVLPQLQGTADITVILRQHRCRCQSLACQCMTGRYSHLHKSCVDGGESGFCKRFCRKWNDTGLQHQHEGRGPEAVPAANGRTAPEELPGLQQRHFGSSLKVYYD